VDLRAPDPAHARSGNFTLETAPIVVQGQPEHITLTIFGLRAILQKSPGNLDIAALDQTGRVVWHQAPFDDPTTFKCLVGTGQSYACGVGSYSVEMPTVGVPAGVYVIRPSFVIPADFVLSPGQTAPSRPPFTLPTLAVVVVTG
jgi:hypothetical protein